MSGAAEPTRILYCGSREWIDAVEGWTVRKTQNDMRRFAKIRRWGRRAQAMLAQMRSDVAAFGSIMVVEGEADGADIASRIISKCLLQAHDPYPVDIAIDGAWPAAGHRRNARMARDGKPTAGRAFAVGDVGTPLSNGTAGMVAILRRMRLPVIIHRDNGIEVQS